MGKGESESECVVSQQMFKYRNKNEIGKEGKKNEYKHINKKGA